MIERMKREPAVLLGLLAAVLAGVTQLVADGSLSWETVVPLVCGIVTRAFVSPATAAPVED
jgi:hypothetical protein